MGGDQRHTNVSNWKRTHIVTKRSNICFLTSREIPHMNILLLSKLGEKPERSLNRLRHCPIWDMEFFKQVREGGKVTVKPRRGVAEEGYVNAVI